MQIIHILEMLKFTPTVKWPGGGNIFFQRLNIKDVNEVRQTAINTAEILVRDPSASGIASATKKLKSYKSPAID
jgi:hypothetical protein